MTRHLEVPYLIIKSPKFVVPSDNTSYAIYQLIDLIQELRVLGDVRMKHILKLAHDVVKTDSSTTAYDLFAELVLLKGEAYKQQKRLSIVREITSGVLYFSYEFSRMDWIKLSVWVKQDRPNVLKELTEEGVNTNDFS